MTPLLSTITRLHIGDGVFVGDSFVERTGRNVYAVNGVSVGGRNTHARTAAYLVVRALGYVVDDVPCSKCGYGRRVNGKSHCRTCRNAGAALCMRELRGQTAS